MWQIGFCGGGQKGKARKGGNLSAWKRVLDEKRRKSGGIHMQADDLCRFPNIYFDFGG